MKAAVLGYTREAVRGLGDVAAWLFPPPPPHSSDHEPMPRPPSDLHLPLASANPQADADADAAASAGAGGSGPSARNGAQGERPARIVVVGASFAGVAAKQALTRGLASSSASVLLVDARPFFEYTPGILRALVGTHGEPAGTDGEPADSMKTWRALVRPEVADVVGTVEGVDEHAVMLKNERIPYDFLVLCSGARYATDGIGGLLRGRGRGQGGLQAREEEVRAVRERIALAPKVLVLGGGIVGVELAAELLERFGDSKEVVLVEKHDELCRELPLASRQYIERWLRKRNVQLVLGVDVLSVTGTECVYLQRPATVAQTCKFDLCVRCTGGLRPNSEPLLDVFEDALSPESGHVLVDDGMHVMSRSRGSLPNVFAAGDVCLHERTRRFRGDALYAESQAHVAAANVIAAVKAQSQAAASAPPLSQSQSQLKGGKEGELRGTSGTAAHPAPSASAPSSAESALVASKKNAEKPRGALFPDDLAPVLPRTGVVSLGELDGSWHYEGFVVNGFLAALAKAVIEETKLLQVGGNPLGQLIWRVADAAFFFVHRSTQHAPIIPAAP